MKLQKTFKDGYMKLLKERVEMGTSLSLYGKDEFEIDSKELKFLANVYEPENLAAKMVGLENDDARAAITLFEAFENISPLLASNEAFWAYICHTSLFNYAQKRWPKVLDNDVSKQYIIDHWFVGSYGILRNAAGSLWWTVYNTIDYERKNKYELTEILCKNYTLRVITFGAYSLIRHREAMIGILDFIKDNPIVLNEAGDTRLQFIIKYFSRLGATKQLAYLDRHEFRRICDSLKSRVLSVTKKEQLTQDESLFY